MKKSAKITFGKNLRKARKAMGWNQQTAALMVGIPRATYGSYEEGRAQPDLSILPTIAEVFSIPDLADFIRNPAFSPRSRPNAVA